MRAMISLRFCRALTVTSVVLGVAVGVSAHGVSAHGGLGVAAAAYTSAPGSSGNSSTDDLTWGQ